MEFHEKLQELRKQKGLTQEELAELLYVSRTAISKWESGRGYPSIDSLKAIALFFSVTIDELLSGDKLLHIAEHDHRQKEKYFRSLIFGLLDCSIAMLLFLPIFGQRLDGAVYEVSLLTLTEVAPYLKGAYFVVVIGMVIWGILALALQNCQWLLWEKIKDKISLLLNGIGTLLFIASLQAYAAILLFIFLAIKVILLIKKH